MKIKVTKCDFDEVCKIEKQKHLKPCRPSLFFRNLLKIASRSDLKATHFTYKEIGMERLSKDEPCLILMNHSSFIDLKICAHVFANRPFNIVCTSDGFVGKEGLMRRIGCIPTVKFVTDVALLKDMKYAVDVLHDSILLFPEASYSFDGTATPLPDSVGKCLKLLKIPVIMVNTYGAFGRDPLYNNLQLRDVRVSADVTYLLSPEEIKEKSTKELNEILKKQFTFDNFKWQQDNHIKIDEDFRADHLNRVLYKCPHCLAEGKTIGKNTKLTCTNCGIVYELTEYGYLKAHNVDSKFTHVPDWYQWERECVRKELMDGNYQLKVPVDIYMMVDMQSIYQVGEGELFHSKEGYHLIGCEGKLDYKQRPEASYSLYADYFWYEIGDMICIGDTKALYYCFPKIEGDIVAKTRLATEELYKLVHTKF